MIKLIAILIFILTNIIYENSNTYHATNWSIFYFSIEYLVLALICIDGYINSYTKIMRSLFIGLFTTFALRVLMELSKINMPYDDYITSLSKNTEVITLGIGTCAIIISVIIYNWKSWLRNLKRGSR